jgi:hypothetical protein
MKNLDTRSGRRNISSFSKKTAENQHKNAKNEKKYHTVNKKGGGYPTPYQNSAREGVPTLDQYHHT